MQEVAKSTISDSDVRFDLVEEVVDPLSEEEMRECAASPEAFDEVLSLLREANEIDIRGRNLDEETEAFYELVGIFQRARSRLYDVFDEGSCPRLVTAAVFTDGLMDARTAKKMLKLTPTDKRASEKQLTALCDSITDQAKPLFLRARMRWKKTLELADELEEDNQWTRKGARYLDTVEFDKEAEMENCRRRHQK